jgi:tRNA(Ile)-lysidine synthase TilS/MesJ
MPPKNKMNLGDITFIRPLSYIREKDILRFAEMNNIPFSPCQCPV